MELLIAVLRCLTCRPGAIRRAAELLRDCGGRVNSLTFGYKWEKLYGENLQTFVRRQRLSVAAMLRQSKNFYVVDMQGSVLGDDGSCPMQVFMLVEKNTPGKGRGLPLGDQLGAHGESEAIKEWRKSRSSTSLTAQRDALADTSAEIVGFAESEQVLQQRGRLGSGSTDLRRTLLLSDDATDDNESKDEMSCMALPRGLDRIDKVGSLLDALEPCISNVDSRMGMRQMHLAWSSRCTCASSAVRALRRLHALQPQAKGRQVKRVDDYIRAMGDVVQSGIGHLSLGQIADTLDVVEGRQGYDTLVLFAANRILQGGPSLVGDATKLDPGAVAVVVGAMARSGHRDPLLYRQLMGVCRHIPAERYSMESMAAILDGLREVGVRDTQLVRQFSGVLQRMPVAAVSPAGIACMANALAGAGAHDDAAFRRLSAAVMQLPGESFSAEAVGLILDAFARSNTRDAAILRRLSHLAQGLDPETLTPTDITRIVAALARAEIRDEALLTHMGAALMRSKVAELTADQIGVLAAAYAKAGVRDEAVLSYLAVAALRLEPWAFDMPTVARIVDAFAALDTWDQALFGRLATVPPPPTNPPPPPYHPSPPPFPPAVSPAHPSATHQVLQNDDPVNFSLRHIGTIVSAYAANPAVRDKALLGKLAMVLQQMDSSVFASHDAVQEVSKILNAYASADMRDLALMLSSTLTNHLKPHVGGLTAQAMANIVLRVGVA